MGESDRFYSHPSGVQAPSVTSVLKVIHSEQLESWKMNQVAEYCFSPGATKTGYKKFRSSTGSNEAALGTWIHGVAERILMGDNASVPEYLKGQEEASENLFNNFYHWMESLKPGWRVLATEVELHGCIDGTEKAYYSGTADAVIELSSKRRVLLDFKSSKAVYAPYGAQLAAYGKAWNETYPEERVNTLWVVRLGKSTTPDFETASPNPHLAMGLFKCSIMTWYAINGLWGNIFP